VYLDKISPEIFDSYDNDAMAFGRLMEDTIAQEMGRRESLKIERCNFLLRSVERPHLLGSVDRFCIDKKRGRGVMEVKTVGDNAYKAWEMAVPPTYYAQLSQYLYVSGCKWGVFCILIVGSRKLIPIYIERDDEYIKLQNEAIDDFWFNHVQKKIPPAMTGKDLGIRPPIEGTHIEANNEVTVAYQKLQIARGEAKDLVTRIEGLEETIKVFMGENEMLTIFGEPAITWKKEKDGETVKAKDLKEKYPEIFKELMVLKKGARKFLPKEISHGGD
jgi:predicted phage-related endonuclease